jgi:hypothetical protein
MRTRALIVVLAAVVLGGCGGGDEPSLSQSSADALHARVEAVRKAADDGDRAKALAALQGLSEQVRDLEAGGSLAKADADALRRGIGRARRKVREEVAAPVATATATATPTATATVGPQEPAGKAKGKKEKDPNGKAKGHGKGDEGDED